jgi:anaerobic selenocysteine-containing dehydrogenase
MIYDDKPVLRAILSAIGAEFDELNQAITDCKNKRWIDTAEGAQLDGLGEIVVQSRQVPHAIALTVFGFYGQPATVGFGKARFLTQGEDSTESYMLQDAEYRLAIAMKARANCSNCTVEDTIQSLKYVFNANRVIIEETGNANLVVLIGKNLTPNEIALSQAINLIIKAGGVGLKYKGYFPATPFGFLGQPNVLGFGQGTFARMF